MIRMSKLAAAAFVAAAAAAGSAQGGNTPAPPNANVYIVWPHDGDVIKGGKLWLRMGARNIGVAPAEVKKPNTGHHHLVLDADLPPFDLEIPADKNHLHFGAGQTEVRLELPPGQHTLQLLMGDHEHNPHNPPLYSEKITITVP